jgi:hypothetical protein
LAHGRSLDPGADAASADTPRPLIGGGAFDDPDSVGEVFRMVPIDLGLAPYGDIRFSATFWRNLRSWWAVDRSM